MRLLSGFVLMAVFASVAGCSPIVDANFAEIQVTRPKVEVPAAGPSSVSVPFSFTVDSSNIGASWDLNQQSLIRSVEMHDLELRATGISDFSFIRTLHAVAFVPLKQPTSPLTPSRQVEIADYVRHKAETAGSVFEVPLADSVDLLPLLQPTSLEQKKIVVQVSLAGQLPTSNWTVDIVMSLSVQFQE